MATRMEAKVIRDRLYRMAKARGAVPPAPELAQGEIQANGGIPYAPGAWGFPDGSVLRCHRAGDSWQWAAFACDPRANMLRTMRSAHKH